MQDHTQKNTENLKYKHAKIQKKKINTKVQKYRIRPTE